MKYLSCVRLPSPIKISHWFRRSLLRTNIMIRKKKAIRIRYLTIEGKTCWVFWAPFLVNAQMRRLILSHLFKWRERQTWRESDSFERKKQLHIIEREKRKNHCDFRIPTRERFSYCSCRFIHHWIGLIFGQYVLHTRYFKLYSWIVKKISRERDKCFTFSALYFGISSYCLYCTNWGCALLWPFVAHFSALVGDSLVSLLIIVKLFLWSERLVVFIIALRDFLH